eukprot:scaffold18690_cov39-Attheya_sp.AAC.1
MKARLAMLGVVKVHTLLENDNDVGFVQLSKCLKSDCNSQSYEQWGQACVLAAACDGVVRVLNHICTLDNEGSSRDARSGHG